MTTNQSKYTREVDYETAQKNTDKGCSPVALCLAPLDPSFTFPPGYPVAKESEKLVVVAMTTVFSDDQYNNQWGWLILPSQVRVQLGEIVEKEGETGWTYWSQQIITGEEN